MRVAPSLCNPLFSLTSFSSLKLSLFHFLCEASDLHLSALLQARMIMIYYLRSHCAFLPHNAMLYYCNVTVIIDSHVYFTHIHAYINYALWGRGQYTDPSAPEKTLLHSWH